MNILSVREHTNYKDRAIRYLQQSWPEVAPVIYEDCISHCIDAQNPLPQWYLLEDEGHIIGCAGLITNDFISRMDLYPWLCAIHINPDKRGNNLAALLINHAVKHARALGFSSLNLCTDLVGYYEKFGFVHIGTGYHPWGESSQIYQLQLG